MILRKHMRILYISSEVEPFSKTGGLADVAGVLPARIAALGHKVAVFAPYYRVTRDGGFDIEPLKAQIEVPIRNRVQKAGLALGTLPGSDVPVYFLVHDRYYGRENLYHTPRGDYLDNAERFIFMSRACLEMVKVLKLKVDVIHANDWQSALVPIYLKTLYADDERLSGAASLLTIHNFAFQGMFWHWDMPLTGLDWKHFNWRELEYYGKVNFLKGGIVYADIVSTVSKTYAKEIQTPEFGQGLEDCLADRADSLFGVLNGVDYSAWDPATDGLIPAKYSADDLSGKAECKAHLQKKLGLPQEPRVPLIGMISRLTDQKGLDILAEAAEKILKLGCQLAVLGTGEEKYHRILEDLVKRYPQKVSVNLAFDNRLAHEIEAGADIYLMPSRYEPCGLNQLYSLRYGTVPVVRKTGGLGDTIRNYTPKGLASGKSTGFVFTKYSGKAMLAVVKKALALYADDASWKKLVANGMAQDFSWDGSAKKYVALYRKAMRVKG
jgi:starch synthase